MQLCRSSSSITCVCVDVVLCVARQAQKAVGFGYENYARTEIVFMGIDNIHVVRDSFKKLQALVQDPNPNDAEWDAAVAETGWTMHVRLILGAGILVARTLHVQGRSVLVHCRCGVARRGALVPLCAYVRACVYACRRACVFARACVSVPCEVE